MPFAFTEVDTFRDDRSWLNEKAFRNMPLISVTFSTVQAFKSESKAEARINMAAIVSTKETFHLDKSELKEEKLIPLHSKRFKEANK